MIFYATKKTFEKKQRRNLKSLSEALHRKLSRQKQATEFLNGE